MPAAPGLRKGTLILRSWKSGKGLHEDEHPFDSLDDLVGLCLQSGNPDVIDRIVLEGQDDQGRTVTLTFAFRSLTGPAS